MTAKKRRTNNYCKRTLENELYRIEQELNLNHHINQYKLLSEKTVYTPKTIYSPKASYRPDISLYLLLSVLIIISASLLLASLFCSSYLKSNISSGSLLTGAEIIISAVDQSQNVVEKRGNLGMTAMPTQDTPILNSTNPANNNTNQNLTVYNQSTIDADNDLIKNIINWKLNGTSITVLNMPFENNGSTKAGLKDYSTYGNNATLTKYHTNVNDDGYSAWNSGKFGNALGFDGTDDYVHISDHASLDITGNITLAAWYKSNSSYTIGSPVIVKDYDGVSAPYRLLVQTSTGAGFSVFNGTAWQGTNIASKENDGGWHFLVGGYNGTHLYYYVDGTLVNTKAIPDSALPANNANLYLGRYQSTYFNGYIDEAQVYNCSINVTEINLTNNTLGRRMVCEDGSDGLVSSWALNETSGRNATDSGSYVNYGTLTNYNRPFWNASGGYYSGAAYQFDGIDDYLKISDHSSLNLTGELAAEFWIKPNICPTSTYCTVLAKYSSTISGGFEVYMRDDNTVDFYVRGGGSSDNLKTTSTVNISSWNHVVAVYNDAADNISVYINNVINSKTSTFVLTNVSADVYLGRREGTVNTYNGTIDEVRIYNRSLSGEQIQVLYENRTNLIVSQETSVGDNWSACITPNDGTEDGTEVCSNNLIIRGAPFITALLISPATAYTNTTLTTNTTYTHDTGENGTVTFLWYINNTNIINQTNNSISSGTTVFAFLNPDNFSRGDQIKVIVSANSSYAESDVLSSNVLTISNLAPYQTAPVLNASSAYNHTTDTLTVYNQSTIDIDNDLVKNVINWKLNSTSITVLNLPFEGGSLSGNISGVINGTRDYSGCGRNSTVYNATWSPTGSYDGWGVYEFDGSGAYIDSGLRMDDIETNYSRTVMAWFKVDGNCGGSTANQNCPIVCSSPSSSYSECVYSGIVVINNTNHASCTVGYDAAYHTIDAGEITRGQWNHLAYVFDGSTRNGYCYLNGVLQGTYDNFGNQLIFEVGTPSRWYIGGTYSTQSRWFNGSIDEVLIFNRSLTSSQIEAVYRNRTDTIVPQETSFGEFWTAEITPNDRINDGPTLESNNITFNLFACGTITDSFILSNNLTANNACLIINHSNLIIDGNGYYLTGNGTGYGINLSGFSNVTVKNFIITNFSGGIVVEGNTFYCSILNNSITTTNTTGAVGIYINQSHNNNFTSNTVVSFIYGLSLFSATNNTFFANNIVTLNDSSAYGILLNNSDTNYFDNDMVNAKNAEDIYSSADSNENQIKFMILANGPNISTTSFSGIKINVNSSPTPTPSNWYPLPYFLSIDKINTGGFIDFNMSYISQDIINVGTSFRLYKHNGSNWTEVSTNLIDLNNKVISSGNLTDFFLFAAFGNISVCVDLHADETNDYYVDVNSICGQCNDSGPGNITTPWCTFGRIFSRSKSINFTGGDTVYIKDGRYRISEVDFATSGAQLAAHQISGDAVDNRTLISGYLDHVPELYFSENISSWTSYTDRANANIYWYNWSGYVQGNHSWIYTYSRFIPQMVVINDVQPIVILQEVNSRKNGFHDASSSGYAFNDSSSSLRTNQSDMIAGDFYYESNTTADDYGKLFLWMPDGSNPNDRNIEVSLDSRIFLGSGDAPQDYVHLRNLALRYAGAQVGASVSLSGSYNIIENLDSSYNAWSGLEGICHNCLVKGCTLKYNGNRGSSLYGNHTIFENNTIEENNWRNYNINWHAGGVKVVVYISNMTFRNNLFKNNNGSGLWFDNTREGNTIEKNIFSGNTRSGVFIEISNGTEEEPIVIKNNIFYENGRPSTGDPAIYIAASHYTYALNNLVYDSPGGVSMHGVSNGTDDNAIVKSLTNNQAYNNIFLNVTFPLTIVWQYINTTVENNTADYNIYFGAGTSTYTGIDRSKNYFCNDSYPYFNTACTTNFSRWQRLGYDNHSINLNPQLTNVSALIFNLTATSVAIDNGTAIREVMEDFSGIARPQGDKYDIGPYEYPIVSPAVVIPPPSGGGAPGKAEVPPAVSGCTADPDCFPNQYCENGNCVDYECLQNSDCPENEYCVKNKCEKIFDLEILQADILLEPGEYLDFNYLVKSMADVAGDVTLEYWLERDGEIIVSKSAVIFIGAFEKRIRLGDLVLPSNLEPGLYKLLVKLSFGTYEVTSHTMIEVAEEVPLMVSLAIVGLSEIVEGSSWKYTLILGINKDEPKPALWERKITQGEEIVWVKEETLTVERSLVITDIVPGLSPGDYLLESFATVDGNRASAKQSFTVISEEESEGRALFGFAVGSALTFVNNNSLVIIIIMLIITTIIITILWIIKIRQYDTDKKLKIKELKVRESTINELKTEELKSEELAQLNDYINQQLRRGVNTEEISGTLIGAGWNPEFIENYMEAYTNKDLE